MILMDNSPSLTFNQLNLGPCSLTVFVSSLLNGLLLDLQVVRRGLEEVLLIAHSTGD